MASPRAKHKKTKLHSDEIPKSENYRVLCEELEEHDIESQKNALQMLRELLVSNPHVKNNFEQKILEQREACYELKNDDIRSIQNYYNALKNAHYAKFFPNRKVGPKSWPQYCVHAALKLVQQSTVGTGELSESLVSHRLRTHRDQRLALNQRSTQAINEAVSLSQILLKLNSYNLIDTLELDWDEPFLLAKESGLPAWVKQVFDPSKIAAVFNSEIDPTKNEKLWFEASQIGERIRSIVQEKKIRIAVPSFDPVTDFTLRYLELNYLGDLLIRKEFQMTTDVVDACIAPRTPNELPFHFMIAGCNTYLLNAGRTTAPPFQFCGAISSISQVICGRQSQAHHNSGVTSMLARSTGMGVYLLRLQERVNVRGGKNTEEEAQWLKKFVAADKPLIAKDYIEFNSNNMRVPLGDKPDSNLNCVEVIYAWDPVADINSDNWKLEKDQSGPIKNVTKNPLVGLFSNSKALNDFRSKSGHLNAPEEVRQLFCRLYMICSQLFLFHPLLNARSNVIAEQLAELSPVTSRYPH